MNRTTEHTLISHLKFAPASWLGLFLGLLIASLAAVAAVDDRQYPTGTPAGLEPIKSQEFEILYVKPGFEPSNYGKLLIEQPEVSMQEFWEWKFTDNITREEVEQISATTARIVHEQFSTKLSAENGYELTESKGDRVLILKPSIIDLHLAAPHRNQNQRTLIKSAGAATLYLEIRDGATSELLLRAIDHDLARERVRFYTASRTTNERDLEIMISRWAKGLRQHLNEMSSGTG
ncbi:MAG TPA: DUF3313 family protein [Gammaproteobacteria bacterium]